MLVLALVLSIMLHSSQCRNRMPKTIIGLNWDIRLTLPFLTERKRNSQALAYNLDQYLKMKFIGLLAAMKGDLTICQSDR